MIGFGGGITLSSYMWYGYSNFDLMIVGRSLGSSALGIYSMALNLAKMPMERIWVAITPLLLPLYSRAGSGPRELGRVLCRMTRYNALILFPLIAGLAAVADDAVSVVLGEKWLASVMPLRLLCVYILTRAVFALLPPALQGAGRLKPLLWFHGVCLVVMPLGFLVGLRWGPAGVAVSWALGYPAVALALLVPSTLRVAEISMRQYLGVLVRPITATLLMVICVLLAGLLPVPSVPRLALRIAVGAFVYLTSVRLLEGSIIEEIRILLGDTRKGIRA
jgi:O-antigen/teichoic acid export membrane protein